MATIKHSLGPITRGSDTVYECRPTDEAYAMFRAFVHGRISYSDYLRQRYHIHTYTPTTHMAATVDYCDGSCRTESAPLKDVIEGVVSITNSETGQCVRGYATTSTDGFGNVTTWWQPPHEPGIEGRRKAAEENKWYIHCGDYALPVTADDVRRRYKRENPEPAMKMFWVMPRNESNDCESIEADHIYADPINGLIGLRDKDDNVIAVFPIDAIYSIRQITD